MSKEKKDNTEDKNNAEFQKGEGQTKRKKTLKTLLEFIVYVVIILAIVYLTPKVLTWRLHTQYPIAAITSGSMWPTLKKNDLVLIKGIQGKEDIKKGDIVVYINPKGFTIHRVIELRENTLVTKGDANNVADAPVKYKEIIGKALTYKGKIIKLPKLGIISNLVRKFNRRDDTKN